MTSAYRFGSFELHPQQRRLLANGSVVALGARAFDVLLVLVERAGQLVTKDELLAKAWPNLIVEENNLQVQVSTLRKLFGTDAIATIPGCGYRFTPRLERVVDAATASPEPSGPRHNLPRSLTSFIGRESDLSQHAEMLAHIRLLTLTGIGGCGKTRLAIRLAEVVLPSCRDGVWFVDLAPVAEPEGLALTVATTVGVREVAGRPIEDTLVAHLAGRKLLLVLDNCEHLLGACAALVERLLLGAPELRALVTSREGLGIAGERVVPVRSLAFPARTVHDVQTLAEFEAVRLFVDRAQQVAADFSLTASNAEAVAEICRRLDGIPLALELAAARVRLLSVEQIRAKLDDRFRLLTGSAKALPRHQTLRAVLDWSYDHLALEERSWLQRLSVFAGGWSLDAATAIAGQGCDEFETLERIGRLVDQSLIVVDRSASREPRYAMLETVRQYAQDCLHASGEIAHVREQHLQHFLALVKDAHPKFFTREATEWSRRIDVELSNVLAAHACCDGVPEGAELGLDLASHVRLYWINRGLFALGERVYVEALAREGADRHSMRRARTLFAFGQHLNFCGRFGEAIAPLEQALAIAREHHDEEYVGYCLDKLAFALAAVGEYVKAQDCVDEELGIGRRANNPERIGSALATKGAIHRMQGDFDAAVAAFEQALPLVNPEDADESNHVLSEIARASIGKGDLPHARETLAEAIRLLLSTDFNYRAVLALDIAALLAAAQGDWRRAVRLQCVFDATRNRMGGFRNPYDDRVLDELRQKPGAMLGADAYEAAAEEGRRLAPEDALAQTLRWLEQPPTKT